MASTYKIQSAAYSGRYMYVDCKQTKDIENNKSIIEWTLTVTGGSANYYSTGPTTVTINGQQVYYAARKTYASQEFPAGRGSVSGTLEINHSADGNKSIAVSLATAIYDNVVQTVSGTWDLDTIPRGAVINSAPNFNDEESPTITYTNYGGSKVTSIQACITFDGDNANIAYRDIPKTSGSYTFALTDAERKKLRAATQGSNSRTVGFYIKTVVDGLTFYSKAWKTFTVINASPTLNPTVEDTNTATLAVTGDKNKIVKGYNTITYNSGGAAKKEATIKSVKVVCGSATVSGVTGAFSNVESNVFKFTITDSRNNTTEQTVTKTLIDYVKITCKLAMNAPTTDGKASFTVSGNYFNGSFGAVANTLTLQYRYKTNDGSYGSWIAISPTLSGNTYKATVNLTGLNYLDTYTFETRATDKLMTRSASKTVKTVPVFDWSESDFNFNVPVSIGGVVIDYIVEQGESDGWTYRKWNSGKAECWKILTLNTAATTAWGALWRGDSFTERQNYPFKFVSKPVENVTLQSGSIGAWAISANDGNGVNGAYASARYTVCRPASTISAEYYLSFYVIGKWK